MGQGDKDFAVWFPIVREQALRCNFVVFNADIVTRDAILFQTSNAKLQRDSVQRSGYGCNSKGWVSLQTKQSEARKYDRGKKVRRWCLSTVCEDKEK